MVIGSWPRELDRRPTAARVVGRPTFLAGASTFSIVCPLVTYRYCDVNSSGPFGAHRTDTVI